MATAEETSGLAALIDAGNADNSCTTHAPGTFDEIVKSGQASMRRICGDFPAGRHTGRDGAVLSPAILQHRQRGSSRGKNASDIAPLVDAMDVMHRGTLDGIALASSESGFTRLARRLRERGLDVQGFDERRADEAFRNACCRFIHVECLVEAGPERGNGGEEPDRPAARKREPSRKALKIFADAIEGPGADGRETLGSAGPRIRGAHRDFEPRSCGRASLGMLAERSGGFGIRKDSGNVRVRRAFRHGLPAGGCLAGARQRSASWKGRLPGIRAQLIHGHLPVIHRHLPASF
ncbi:MAG: NYN domain-containing protein [Boseongicola sp.]|nr:NYN domain-containing protein [Boseongicola sp.]